MWLIGSHVLANLFLAMPSVENAGWRQTVADVEEQIKIAFTWSIAILVLFASIKMLTNAASRGAE